MRELADSLRDEFETFHKNLGSYLSYSRTRYGYRSHWTNDKYIEFITEKLKIEKENK